MKKNIILSILSGLFLWMAWPPATYTTFLLFIGFVPLLIAIENIIQSDTSKKGKKIFWTSFLGFFIWNVLSVYWVYNALKMVGELVAVPVTLVPYALGPILMATACWLYYRTRLLVNRNWSLAAFVCFWIGYEYLNQCWDLNFPWMTIGNGFAMTQQWVQWYEFTGVYGGTLWVLILNIAAFLIYLTVLENTGRQLRIKLITAFVIVLIVPLGYSLTRYYTYSEQSNPANIVIVQPNIDPYAKVTSIPTKVQLDILTRLSDSLGQHNTEFFIWPELLFPKQLAKKASAQILFFCRPGVFWLNTKTAIY